MLNGIEVDLLLSTDSDNSDSSSVVKADNEKITNDLVFDKIENAVPKFTDEELEHYSQKLSSLVTLPHILELHIDAVSNLAIRNFIQDEDISSLFFFKNAINQLEASHVIPSHNFHFMYFLKSKNDLRSDNFMKKIIIGYVDRNFDNTLILNLKFMFSSNIYFAIELPYRVRIQLVRNFEKVLCKFTEVFYKDFGLTLIHIPSWISSYRDQVPKITISDLLQLLETIVINWNMQFRNVLTDSENIYDYVDLANFSPLIIIRIWEYKLDNLLLVRRSLQMEYVSFIRQILQDHNSVHVTFLKKLEQKISERIIEMKLNVRILYTLKPISEKIENSSLDNMLNVILELMVSISVILRECEFSQQKEKSSILIFGMSQQIISVCKRKIKVNDIFHGDTEFSMKTITQSVSICSVYIQLLKQDYQFCIFYENNRLVVRRIELFIQRCTDLLELCSLINIFFNVQSYVNIRIRFENQVKMTASRDKILNDFLKNLENLGKIQNTIMDFHKEEWDISRFRFLNEMENIKRDLFDFVDKLFAFVVTIEDKVDVLRTLYQFSKWKPVEAVFEMRRREVLDKFFEELSQIRHYLLSVKVILLHKKVNRFEEITLVFIKKKRLQFLLKLLDTNTWLKPTMRFSEPQPSYLELYFEIISEINEIIIKEYKEWNEKLNSNFLITMKQPLITKCFYNPEFLESNIDRKLLQIMKDANMWTEIGFIPTISVEKLISSSHQILIVEANVEELIMTYNRIICKLSNDEKALFSPFLQFCGNIIHPVLNSINWDHESANKTILEYLKHIKYVEALVSNYKNQSERIIESCEQICQLEIVRIQRHDLNEIIQDFNEFRLLSFRELIHSSNQITSCLQIIYNSFKHYILKAREVWNLYVRKIDGLLKEALKYCLKNSLENILHCISADQYTKSNPMKINMSLKIKEQEAVLEPQPSKIEEFFTTLKLNLFEIIKLIPRVSNSFKLSKKKEISNYVEELFEDEEINNLQFEINQIIQGKILEIQNKTKLWNKYESLWKLEVNDHIEKHITTFTDLDPFEIGFMVFRHVISEMKSSTFLLSERISIFYLHYGEMKTTLINLCEIRLECIAKILKQLVNDRLQNIGNRIDQEFITLQKFEYRTNADIILLKSVFSEAEAMNKEIQRLQNYMFLLERFQFKIDTITVNKKEQMAGKLLKYRNMIDQCRLKLQKVYNIHI